MALEVERKAAEYQLQIAPGGIDPPILLDAIDTFTETKPKGGVRDIARQIEDRIADGLIEAKAEGATHIRLEYSGKRVRVVPMSEEEALDHARAARAEAMLAG